MIYKVILACMAAPVLAKKKQSCAPLEAGLQTQVCNGNSYAINVPTQCAAGKKACGMIFGAHGFTQDTEEHNRNTRMRALGEANDYVVVHPQGNAITVQFTNFAFAAPGFDELSDGNVYQTLLDLRDDLEIDPKRVHMNGFSQGAWMTWRVLCNQASLWPEPRSVIASFGPMSAGLDGSPVGGSALSCFGPNDIGGSPTAILHIHGENDPVVPFDPEAVNAVNAITEAIGDDLTVVDLGGNDFFNRTCRVGNDLLYETIFHQQGHCVIGRTEGDCNSVGEPMFTAGEELMEFFKAHPFVGRPNKKGGGTAFNCRDRKSVV